MSSCFQLPAYAGEKSLGAGLIIGEPTGISLKYWISKRSAVDFALAWSLSGNNSLHIHSDYLLHNYELFTVRRRKLPLYYGVGVRYIDEEEKRSNKNKSEKKKILGIRVPGGVAYFFENIPVDIFIEVVPVVNLYPDTDFDLEIATGARYFF